MALKGEHRTETLPTESQSGASNHIRVHVLPGDKPNSTARSIRNIPYDDFGQDWRDVQRQRGLPLRHSHLADHPLEPGGDLPPMLQRGPWHDLAPRAYRLDLGTG
jgi:hypothetical protein